MVRKVIVSVLVSFDGYMADEQGDTMPLMKNYKKDLTYIKKITTPADFDTIIVGKNTYLKEAYELTELAKKGKKIYVLTHQQDLAIKVKNLFFEDCDVAELVERLQQQPGGNIWVYGGSHVINQFTSRDLVDEIHLYTVPIELKQGIVLFDARYQPPTVELLEITQNDEITYSRWGKGVTNE